MPDHEEEVRQALEEVLAMYDIKLDLEPEEEKGAEEYSDYAEVISKTQERLDELNEKAEEIYQRTGMNQEQLEAYAANPNNFSKEQWDALQKVREACDKYKREARTIIGEEQFASSVEKREKRQPKRFAKKKHWIEM